MNKQEYIQNGTICCTCLSEFEIPVGRPCVCQVCDPEDGEPLENDCEKVAKNWKDGRDS